MKKGAQRSWGKHADGRNESWDEGDNDFSTDTTVTVRHWNPEENDFEPRTGFLIYKLEQNPEPADSQPSRSTSPKLRLEKPLEASSIKEEPTQGQEDGSHVDTCWRGGA